MASRVLRRLSPKSSALLLCDMQEKFRPSIGHFEEVVGTSARLLKAASVLGMRAVATEQYPKGLGHSVPELQLQEHKVPIFAKTCFSMVSPEVLEAMGGAGTTDAVLVGIEAHACVFQTTLDLLHKGIKVHVVADAVSSRSAVERKFALEGMREAGAYVTTSECVLLNLLGDAAHPHFRQVQKLIMHPAPETGLRDL